MRAASLLVGGLLMALPSPVIAGGEWGDEADSAVLETVVEGERAAKATRSDARRLDAAALATATPEDALEALGGVQLTREGGPLAPARLRMRGLGGARVSSDLMGLGLDDPLSGSLDAAALPLWAAPLVVAEGPGRAGLGGRLGLSLEEPAGPFLRGRLGAGTLETLRLDAFGGAPVAAGKVSAGLGLSSTRGDFTFVPSPPAAVEARKGRAARRENNDQRRGSALVHASLMAPLGRVEVLGFAHVHEGGVPGMATAPTDGLRGNRAAAGGRAAFLLEEPAWDLEIDAAALASSRSTWDRRQPEPDEVSSWRGSAGARLSTDALGAGVTTGARLRAVQEGLLSSSFSRSALEGRLEGRLHLLGGRVLLEAEGGGALWSGVGALPAGRVGLELRAGERAAVGTQLSHEARAPTLDELYAPRGFVLGNPELAPERSSDAEVYALYRRASLLLRVAAYGGRLHEAILYLNRNAFEIEPVNAGGVWRAGLEGRAHIEPHRLVGVEVSVAALTSRLDVTGAPLPSVAPVSSRTTLRLGTRDGARMFLVGRQRDAVTNNLYGTLRTDGYLLLDLVTTLPISAAASFHVALTNALDVLDARDTNLLPLPGRQLFFSLEVRA